MNHTYVTVTLVNGIPIVKQGEQKEGESLLALKRRISDLNTLAVIFTQPSHLVEAYNVNKRGWQDYTKLTMNLMKERIVDAVGASNKVHPLLAIKVLIEGCPATVIEDCGWTKKQIELICIDSLVFRAFNF